MNTPVERERSRIAEYFTQCLTKYLYTVRDTLDKSFTLKVSPCELNVDYSVFLEVNQCRALVMADLDTVDAMDNESVWNNETIRVADELLGQIRKQVERRDEVEGNNLTLSSDLVNVRKAILGDMYNIVRETNRIIITKKRLSSSDERHPYHGFPVDIRDVLAIIGDVIEVRIKQIEKREETRE